ncbi:MAG: pentapeptide repeat-containing protein [Cyanobacteriota bacterium]|nr:pentapeptide repeat-containing protein [Cyanobacteriota bacterium]
MIQNNQQPREFDAILGGTSQKSLNSAVLGGIEGVKMRLDSPWDETRFAAVSEALKYGKEGLDLVIKAFKDGKLIGGNLSGIDLTGADLRGADLREANLSFANLSEANLELADLRKANLSNAKLQHTNLTGAKLAGANLRGADLT